jgi:acetoin utilization deacetylase AcuC-like enzyme
MRQTAIVRDPSYREHTNGPGHPERPERLEAIDVAIEGLPRRGRLLDLPARDATPGEIARIHDPAYIERVEQTSRREHTRLDPDTGAGPGSWRAAVRAAGGTIEAVRAVLEGRAANAFALVRPPGHHAEADRAMGFCLFNNAAIGAAWALQEAGLRRVLILDWDVHHGNGTQNAFYDRPDVLYVSFHQAAHYPGTGQVREVGRGPGEGRTVNVPLPPGRTDEDYLGLFRFLLEPVAREYRPELIVVSAGFDAHRLDPLADMDLTAEGFGRLAAAVRRLAEECCRGRLVLVLEGGYHLAALGESVGRVLWALLGEEAGGGPDAPPGPPAAAVLREVREVQGRYWKALGRGSPENAPRSFY